jgi:hypothetical protein
MKAGIHFFIISLSSYWNGKCLRRKLYTKSKQNLIFGKFFFENRDFYEIMLKNIAQPDSPQMT